jgi:solute carrier family 45 protein 1/2/4
VTLPGYFPFMFYSTTWVGETYFRYERPEAAYQSSDTLGDVGRLGSLSLVMFSIISFLTSVILPLGVRSPDGKSIKPRPPPRLASFLNRFMQYRPTLQTVWYTSHFVFAATMIFAPLARSVKFTTFLVAVCGIPLAISGWAPFTFMGIEINRLALEPPTASRPTATMITSTSFRTHGYRPVGSVDRDVEMDVLHVNHRHADDDDNDSDNESLSEAASTGELSGIYLGVLNVYTTIPQFVGTFISWIVFSILEPATPKPEEGVPDAPDDGQWMNRNPDAPNAIAVCLFIGALAALVAAEATRRFNALR